MKLMPWKTRDSITDARLNTWQDATVMNVLGGKGIAVNRLGNDVVVSLKKKQPTGGKIAAGTKIKFAKVVDPGFDDHIECTSWEPGETEPGEAVNVAKPYMLQRTPFDGQEITYYPDVGAATISYMYDNWYRRHATRVADPQYNETQVIVPGWFVDELLLILKIKTDVIVDDANLEWMDLGMTSRLWGMYTWGTP